MNIENFIIRDFYEPLDGSILCIDPWCNQMSKQTFNTRDITLNSEDRWLIIQKMVEEFGLASHHIRSYDEFIEEGIKRVIETHPVIDAEVGYLLDFRVATEDDPQERVRIEPIPRSLIYEYDGSPTYDITPLECRMRRMTYAIPIYAWVALKRVKYEGGRRVEEVIKKDRVLLMLMPLVVGSKYDPYLSIYSRKDPEYLAEIGEDPMDLGGYMIINGSERVVVVREEGVRGRILTEALKGASPEAKKFAVQAWLVSPGTYRNRITVYMGREDLRLYARFTRAGTKEPIPIVLLMRALGFTMRDMVIAAAPEEYRGESKWGNIVTTVILLSAQGIKPEALRTQENALFELAKYMDNFRIPITERNRERVIQEVKRRLNLYLLPHLGIDESAWPIKGYYIARMIRRVVLIYFNHITPEDRDHYKNKRLKMVGDFLEELFAIAWRSFIEETKRKIVNLVSGYRDLTAIKSVLRTDKLSDIMMSAIATGHWPTGVTGVTEILGRLNYLDNLSHLRRVKNILTRTSAEAKRGKVEARDLHPTQWGRVCPNETPEGELCGLTKHLALMAYVTADIKPEEKDRIINEILPRLGVMREPIKIGWTPYPNTPVFVDGMYVGYISDPEKFVNEFRELRRRGEIPWQVSIKYWEKYGEVHINTDRGRILRPLIIVRDGKPQLQKEHIKKLRKGEWKFTDLIKNGVIEMLDPEEEEDAYIAIWEKDLTPEHTHLEIAPAGILGISAGTIPFANHDQSPKVTHETSMAKQAISIPRPNYRIRPETSTYILHYPQKPLVTTKPLEIAGVSKRGFGQNAIVAVLAYEGYNIEDALIINKASIERGFMRGALYRIYEVEERRYIASQTDEIRVPTDDVRGAKQKIREKLGEDGIAWPGVEIYEDELIVGRVSPSEAGVPGAAVYVSGVRMLRDTSEKIRKGEGGYVDTVVITTTKEGTTLVRAKLRQPRYPELGDKFASRHGQKGVIGLIVPQEDMPFDEYGMTPDIILNPHSIPSRMTIGQLLESLAGDIAAKTGKSFDGTAFESDDWLEELVSIARKLGLNYYGEKTLFDGKTGKMLKTHVLMGPVYYQRLKHLAKDKLHARARGKVTVLTMQPTEGKARGGGLRLGEMERDALLGQGVSQFLNERFVESSDGIDVYVCSICGLIGHYNPDRKRWQCPIHGDVEMHRLTMPYAFVLLINELMSLAVRVKLNVEDAF